MHTIMNTPEQRQIVWDRRIAQLDHDAMMASARREGLAQGKAQGAVEALAGLVKDGILSVSEAAKRSNMTVSAFAKQAGVGTDK